MFCFNLFVGMTMTEQHLRSAYRLRVKTQLPDIKYQLQHYIAQLAITTHPDLAVFSHPVSRGDDCVREVGKAMMHS